MLRRRNGWAARVAAAVGLIGLLGAAGAGAAGASTCTVPGYGESINPLWSPDMAPRSPTRVRGRVTSRSRCEPITASTATGRPRRVVGERGEGDAARRLPRPSGRSRNRPLNGYDESLLWPMIELLGQQRGVHRGRDRRRQRPGGARAPGRDEALRARDPIWGKTRITAADQTKFFYNIDHFIVTRHRAYGMHLLASITPSQRWGIGEVAPRGWNLYFKGGWGYGTGLLDHQVVLLKRGCTRVSLAVLTMYDGSHPYGKDTLQGIFERLLHEFPTAGAAAPARGRSAAIRTGERRLVYIGAPGFEPGTSATQRRRATRLRHAPTGRRV